MSGRPRRASGKDSETEAMPPPPAPATAPVTTRRPRSTGLQISSVVKVYVVASKPNYLQPWQMSRQEACSGSGFVIEGKRILTNAHVVTNFTTVRVRRHGGHQKWPAKVLSINEACDLAILTIEDEEFWKDLPCLRVSEDIPELDENVLVVGYPMGGDTLCVTRGVVSRVTTLHYEDNKYMPSTSPQMIAVQIDAAINSGNSGGPVFKEDGTVVGVAFSGYAGSADNIGYIIPFPVIKNFMQNLARNDKWQGVCDFGFRYELCENPSLQKKYHITPPKSGVLVIKVKPLGPSHDILKAGDIIMAIDGKRVENDGTIDFRGDERLSMQHLISNHMLDKGCNLRVLRNGTEMTVTLIGGQTPPLVPLYRVPGSMPSYLIVGGVVFTTLTGGLIELAIDDLDDEAWEASRQPKKYEDQELIVIINILAHPVNHGYSFPRIPRLAKANEQEVRNMKMLKQIVDESKDFVHFQTPSGKSVVFDVEECKQTEEEILQTYAIPAACSSDLLKTTEGAENGTKPAVNGHSTKAADKKRSKKPKKDDPSKTADKRKSVDASSPQAKKRKHSKKRQ